MIISTDLLIIDHFISVSVNLANLSPTIQTPQLPAIL